MSGVAPFELETLMLMLSSLICRITLSSSYMVALRVVSSVTKLFKKNFQDLSPPNPFFDITRIQSKTNFKFCKWIILKQLNFEKRPEG